MKKTLKDLDRLQRVQLTFQSNTAEIVKDGKTVKEKVSRITNDGLDMAVVAKYYNHDDEQFAIKNFRDYIQNFAFTVYEFNIRFKGKDCFCRVLLGQHKHENRIASTYEVTLLRNGKTRELCLASDEFDMLTEDERDIIMMIEKCKVTASYFDMLEKVEGETEEIE